MRNYTAKFNRRISTYGTGRSYDITLLIDVDDLLRWLGEKATKNKSRTAYHLHKAVKVTATEVIDRNR